jgi:hypothetical protein
MSSEKTVNADQPRTWTSEVEKMSMEERKVVYLTRMAWSKKTGEPMCEHPWEIVSPWDSCTSGPDGFDVLERRSCGHIVCARHILMHGFTVHNQLMFGMLGADGKPVKK